MTDIVNHLWQSTLFAAMAALAALALKGTQAKVRYWLWLAASIKFLIPFSLLVTLGSQVDLPPVASAGPMLAVEQIGRSFAPIPAIHSTVPPVATPWWPAALAAIWVLVSLEVLRRWALRWLVLHKARRTATPLPMTAPIPIRTTRSEIEPGVFGIFRPVLLLPEGIFSRLSAEELDSVLCHELAHVRRRDNLTAAVHMLVEALFWFHPLVWWIGARLVEERERACDEEVLRLGKRPQAYAEGILRVCKFYLESPLPCAPGVTGADLAQRIEEIMTNRITQRLTFTRKTILAALGLAAVTTPIFIGVLNAQTKPDRLVFEVASIRPSDPNARGMRFANTPDNGLNATGVTLKTLIEFAYDVQDFQVSGGPSWFRSDRYDIVAKPEKPAAADLSHTTADADQRSKGDRLRERIRSLLTERFQLAVRRETGERTIYSLVEAKNGHKLKPPSAESSGISRNRGFIAGGGVAVGMLAKILSSTLARPVLDRTGIEGKFDFKLEWTEDSTAQGKGGEAPGGAAPPEASGPSIFTAIQDQLGLKLESGKGPVEIIVIERAEKPSEN